MNKTQRTPSKDDYQWVKYDPELEEDLQSRNQKRSFYWHQKLRNTWKSYSHHKGFKRALYTILGALTVFTLHKIAKKMDIAGHWKMKKPALVAAIAKHRKKAVGALIGLGLFYGSIKFLRSETGKALMYRFAETTSSH